MNTYEARAASISGTRQMISEDSFAALVSALVECNAVPRDFMASALEKLAGDLVAKAKGETPTDWQVFPSECFERARNLNAHAALLRGCGR